MVTRYGDPSNRASTGIIYLSGKIQACEIMRAVLTQLLFTL